MTTRNLKNFNANQIGVWAGIDPVLEAGSLSWDSDNGLRLHDGTTPGGNVVGSGGVGGPVSQLTSGTASVTLNSNLYGGITNALNHGKKVVVHCLAGQQRSPTIVTGYLMGCCKLTTQAAIKLIRDRKHDAFFWEVNFKDALQRYAYSLTYK